MFDLAPDLLGGFAEGLLLQLCDLQAKRLNDQIMGPQRCCQLLVLSLQFGDLRLERAVSSGRAEAAFSMIFLTENQQ